MAVYKTRTKVIMSHISDEADTVATSHAGLVNDYVETLDSTTGAIISTSTCIYGHKMVTVIVHLTA